MMAGVCSGLAGLVFPGARSNVVEKTFPLWLLIFWYGSLMLWCGLVVAVTFRPDKIRIQPDKLRTRMLFEASGLTGMGFSCASYGIAALSYTGASALTAALFVGLFAGAALWRVGEIRTDLRKLDRVMIQPEHADPPPLADPEER